MSYPSEVREQIRSAKLRQAREDPRGVATLQLTLGSASAVTLYAVVRMLEVDSLALLGIRQAAQGVWVEIPRQSAGDSPSGDSYQGGVIPGDRLVYSGVSYVVRAVDRDDTDMIDTLIATCDLAVQKQ